MVDEGAVDDCDGMVFVEPESVVAPGARCVPAVVLSVLAPIGVLGDRVDDVSPGVDEGMEDGAGDVDNVAVDAGALDVVVDAGGGVTSEVFGASLRPHP